jgi:hypothetical protein
VKNKYIVFVSIGFELIALILIAIYLGQYLVEKQGLGQAVQAFLIVFAFIVWFISLIVKLKAREKSSATNSSTGTSEKTNQ